jgi:hypothetical protein
MLIHVFFEGFPDKAGPHKFILLHLLFELLKPEKPQTFQKVEDKDEQEYQ